MIYAIWLSIPHYRYPIQATYVLCQDYDNQGLPWWSCG